MAAGSTSPIRDWGFDEHQVAALNDAWNILPAPPPTAGVRGKLTAFVWGIVAPYLQRQLTFNSWVVDHLNRNLEASRTAHQAALEDAEALRAHLARSPSSRSD